MKQQENQNYSQIKSFIMQDIKKMANRVFRQLGSGHTEKTYQNALLAELLDNNYTAISEYIIPIQYITSKGNMRTVSNGRVDILAEKDNIAILIELKTLPYLGRLTEHKELLQIIKYINYLPVATSDILPMLINFPVSVPGNPGKIDSPEIFVLSMPRRD